MLREVRWAHFAVQVCAVRASASTGKRSFRLLVLRMQRNYTSISVYYITRRKTAFCGGRTVTVMGLVLFMVKPPYTDTGKSQVIRSSVRWTPFGGK